MPEPDIEFRDGYPVFPVGHFVQSVNALLDETMPFVWVSGEISGFKQSAAGHLYFSLKDDSAALSCACFRGNASRLRFQPEDGLEVIAGGTPEIYKERGSFQLIVRQMDPLGSGALALAFAQLKQKLQSEGLFDADRKKELPGYPRTVGIVTSPTGSVIRDILSVSGRRNPGIDIVVSPSLVQGNAAEQQLIRAIKKLDRHPGIDVIIVARGGGSLEDLWPFNTEGVARAIADCTLPVVSAVGHETDFTISDFVADVRAPTPSAAAELLFPDRIELQRQLVERCQRLDRRLQSRLNTERQRLDDRRTQLRDPGRSVGWRRERLETAYARLGRGIGGRVEQRASALAGLSGRLHTVSPLQVLARGFAYPYDPGTGTHISSTKRLKPGDQLAVQLQDGVVQTKVELIEPK